MGRERGSSPGRHPGPGEYSRLRKLALSCAIFALVLVAPAMLKAETDDPWEVVKEFTFIPDSIVRVERHYVAALFYHSEKGLYALVIYTADCESGSCTIQDNVAYAVTDARGVLIQRYVKPQEELLLKSILTNQSFI